MIRETISVMRDIGRLREIGGILMAYGWGDLVNRLGLGKSTNRLIKWVSPARSESLIHLAPEVRVRLAIEELGPTFVKLGQVLATRKDIFPESWIVEFAKLQDKVPPVPFEELLPELEQALGRSPFEVFKDLDTTPLAAASIAQVHLAKLQDGTPVVLKIRRPNVEALIDADLRLLSHLGRLIEAKMPESRRFQPGKIIGQFSKSLRRELDLAMEGRNADRFIKNFEGDPTICFPKVYWESTSASLLVMEHIDGIPGNDLQSAQLMGLNLKVLAANGANAVLKMVLVDGFFHADPHPGNLFYLANNRVAMIDCGMVGRLSPARRDEIADLLASLASKDIEGLRDILVSWAGDVQINEAKLAADVDEFISNYDSAPLKQIGFANVLNDLTSLMRNNSLAVPPDLTMLFKAIVTLEGLGRQLDPDFQIVKHLTPFVRQVILDRYKPKSLLKHGKRKLHNIMDAATSIPKDVSKILRQVQRGSMKIEFDLKRLDHFGHQIDHSTNRLTMGLITAALIIGSSIVMTVKTGPMLFGLPAFGFIGFSLAFLNGFMLMVSIWRSGRD